MPLTKIQTTTGTARPEELGRTVIHEHILVARLLVGHSDGADDHDDHRARAGRGAFVGFDRFGISLFQPVEVRVANVVKLIEVGHLERVLMSHDSIVRRRVRSVPCAQCCEDVLKRLPQRRPTHIPREIVPMLRERGISDAQIETILVNNPQRPCGAGFARAA